MKNKKKFTRKSLVTAMVAVTLLVAYLGLAFAAPAEQEYDAAFNADPQYILVERDIYVGALAKWELTDEEVELIARVVMSVARGEQQVVQQAVVQCIRTSCEDLGLTVVEAIDQYGWPVYCEVPADAQVYAAIEDVVNGFPAIDTDIHFCYNPGIQTGEWHESQLFVAEIGSLRFFKIG